MISHDPKFVFIHVPKAAGSSIESSLQRYSAVPIRFEDNGNAVLANKHVTAAQVRNAYGERWHDYYSFAVARNPWDRVVSNYFYLRQIGHQRVEGIGSPGDWVKKDMVWCLPVSHYVVADGEVIVDFLIQYDSLQEGLDQVCDRLDIPRVRLEKTNRSSHDHYRDYYDGESRERVAELFREDIERFGFTFDGRVPGLDSQAT